MAARHYIYKRLVSMVMALALVFASAFLAFAEEGGEVERTVKVGFSQLSGYHVIIAHARSGYGYDFLQSVATYNNWSYTYVGYNNTFFQMFNLLDSGEIDVFTGVPKREDRLAGYVYSEPIGSATIQLIGRSDLPHPNSADPATFDNAKIGIVKGAYYAENVQRFIDNHRLNSEIIYFPSDAELRTALKSANLVDFIASSSIRKLGSNEIVLRELYTEDICAVAKSENRDLIDSINYSIAQMNTHDPSWRTKLFNKYYSKDEDNEIVLTAAERSYLDKLQKDGTVITVAVNPDNSPYSWSKDGSIYKGIIPAIISQISEELDLEFEIVEAKSRANYEEHISAGKVDIVADACNDFYFAESNGFRLTSPYITTGISKVTRTDAKDMPINKEVVAAPFNKDFIENSKKTFYGNAANITYYQTLEECMEAVKNKNADACYVFQYTAQEALNNDLENKLQATLMPGEAQKISFAVSDKSDFRLISLLNKGIGGLNEDAVQSIMIQYASITNTSFSIIRFFYTHPMAILAIAVILLGSAFAVFMGMARRQHTIQLEKTNNALTIAVAKAEHAMDARTRFFSQMSHEIRTPMNAIVGLTELAQVHVHNPEMVEEYLTKIGASSKVLLSIINDVLDMSSIENNKLKIASTEFDLGQVLDNIESIYLSQCKAKGIEFSMKKNIANQHLVGDSLRINQILLNLISNAFKFTESGGRIEMVASEISRKGDVVFIRFTVEDTGSGMTKEMLERLFKPFEQESALTARKHGGSGLGMSITKNLVDLMDGSINVESAKDVGTRFTVDIPFKTVGTLQVETEVEGSQLKALLVGGDAQQLEYLQLLATQFGVSAVACLSSEDGSNFDVEVIGKDFSVCIIDELSVAEATVRLIEHFRQLLGDDAILVLASSKNRTELPDIITSGKVDRYIKKPILQSDISSLMESINTDEGKEEATVDFGGKTVLLAEDNEINAEIMIEILDMVNVKADHARNGKEALDMFCASEKGTYVAILMDLQMPEMDGIEAAKAIRASSHPEAATIPIVAQSANAFNEDVAMALSAGMNAHVSKPISTKELYETLEKCINKEF